MRALVIGILAALMLACPAHASVAPAKLRTYLPPIRHPRKAIDPYFAVGKLVNTSSRGLVGQGSATIIGPRRVDGRWDVLTAAHCVDASQPVATLHLKDGRALEVHATHHDVVRDLCWMVTQRTDLEDLPHATIARTAPRPGTAVWHCGYGINGIAATKRYGWVVPATVHNRLAFSMLAIFGDSGGGIFDGGTWELVAVVASTERPGHVAPTFAGPGNDACECRPTTLDRLPRFPRLREWLDRRNK